MNTCIICSKKIQDPMTGLYTCNVTGKICNFSKGQETCQKEVKNG